MSSDPRKTLSGKSELELLGEIETLKDQLLAAEEAAVAAEEAKEGLELDLELAKEEKMLLEADMEEMQMRVTIAETRAAAAVSAAAAAGGGGASAAAPAAAAPAAAVSAADDAAAAALMAQLQRSAAAAQEESSRLRAQLQDMREHVAALDSQTAIIDNLTERNLELSDEADAARSAMTALKEENEELKQLQFMLDEELALQREQADEFAAKISALQARLAADGSEADTHSSKLEARGKALEEELAKASAGLREARLKALQASQGVAAEMHSTNVVSEHLQALISRRYLPRHGFQSRFGLLGSGAGASVRALLTSVKPEELLITSEVEAAAAAEKKRDDAAEAGAEEGGAVVATSSSSSPSEQSAEAVAAVAKALSGVFGHVEDASHVMAVHDGCDAAVRAMGLGMAAMGAAVRLIARSWRASAANSSGTAGKAKASSSLVSPFDMAVMDAAVAHCTLYADLQQLTAALVDARYRRHLHAYCAAKRSALAASAANANTNGTVAGLVSSSTSSSSYPLGSSVPTNVLEALAAIANGVGLVTAAATAQTHAGAGHHALAAAQLQRYVAAIRSAMAVIHSELAPFFASYVCPPTVSSSSGGGTTAAASEPRRGLAAAVELSCGGDAPASWWAAVPSGPSAQAAAAQLVQSLVLAAAFGCEQAHRTLTGPALSPHVAIARPDSADGDTDDEDGAEDEVAAASAAAEEEGEPAVDEEGNPIAKAAPTASPKKPKAKRPLNNNFLPSELGGRINAIEAAGALQETLALLHRADGQLRGHYGALLTIAAGAGADASGGAEEAEAVAAAASKAAAGGFASLRFATVEGSVALLLIFRSLMAFAALLRTAEHDVSLGLSDDVGAAFNAHCQSSGNGRLQCVANAMAFLEAPSSSSSSSGVGAGGGDGDGADGGDGAVSANLWRTDKSLALSHVCAVYGVAFAGNTIATASAAPIEASGFFVVPLLRTVMSGLRSASSAATTTTNSAGKPSAAAYDDLRNSSTATLASLFVHGGVRKDINSFVSSSGSTAVVSASSDASDQKKSGSAKGILSSAAAASVRAEMLAAVAKAAPELFAGLGGVGPGGAAGGSSAAEAAAAAAGAAAEVARLSQSLEAKSAAHAALAEKCDALEMRLWEAQAEQNVVQMMQREAETMRGAMKAAEVAHAAAIEQQAKDWGEAYESIEKARQALSREVRQLKSEEKLSPLSAAERRQHSLLLGYYSTLLGEVLMGGSGAPAPIGLRSDNGNVRKACAELVDEARDHSYTSKLADVCEAASTAPSPILIGPQLPKTAGLCATKAFPLELHTSEPPLLSRLNGSFLSTEAADRLLRLLHRKPTASTSADAVNNKADGGEADQPSTTAANGTAAAATSHKERVEAKQREILANRKRHEGSTLYLTSLPKIRRFTSAAECKESRLGVLLSTQ